MIRKEKDGIVWLEFELLQGIEGLKHGVFLRHGGVSKAPFDSLNMSHHVGDQAEAVSENWKRVAELMRLNQLEGSIQTHGKNVEEAIGDLAEVENCDALITNRKGIGLLVRHADCQAAVFYDPKQKAIANVHAGWRGNAQNIYGETVKIMGERYGSRPEDLLVGISPSLGPCHSEFKHYRDELPESFWKFEEAPLHFNLWKVAREQLEEAGVKRIEIAEICTFDNEADYYSFRRAKTTGRHATIIGLE